MKILISIFLLFSVQKDEIQLKAKMIDDFVQIPNCGTAILHKDYRFVVMQNIKQRKINDTIHVRIYCPTDVLKKTLNKDSTYLLTIKRMDEKKMKLYELIDIKY